MDSPSTRAQGTIHVIGGGPVGLLLAALLQSVEGQRIRIYEKRETYTRTRRVSLAPYLLAETIESYREDKIDGQDVAAIFDPVELETRLAYRRTVAPDLRAVLEECTNNFTPLNVIEQRLDDLIRSRGTGDVERVVGPINTDRALSLAEPDDVIVDCTGARGLLRDLLAVGDRVGEPGANTALVHLQYVLVVNFKYDEPFECDELCKYYKNRGNTDYKFIPAINRTNYDGEFTHLTGVVPISQEDYAAMRSQFDDEWLRENFPEAAAAMDRFVEHMQEEHPGNVVGGMQFVRISLDVYHAWNATSRHAASDPGHPFAQMPVFLLGDSAIGSPYFQSISLGFECAFHLAGHLANTALPLDVVFDRYETFMNLQWLRVFMRSQMIKHNMDLLQVVDDKDDLLGLLHIY